MKKVLAYLERSHKILFTSQGIVSTNNLSSKLQKVLSGSQEFRSLVKQALTEQKTSRSQDVSTNTTRKKNHYEKHLEYDTLFSC